ncbi:MAG TPA: MBL fold metallo-hydrolase [Methanolinea sp.]|nr:MBL fold metallo-hydrolase [Methanolinea sp.]HQK55627.1 MBL fold metallo-hydrolase [Methanolinea sp.]
MEKYAFVARIPDQPGSLHKAAEIISCHKGNINRIQFDRRIDPYTVFFEVTSTPEAKQAISRGLLELGYLQTALKPLSFLKLSVHIPHIPGALLDFLQCTTAFRANIAMIDFDDRGSNPDLLTVSLNLEESAAVSSLLDQIKSRYRMEVLEYDTSGKHLDDTVFYLRFAQAIRNLVGGSEDSFLLRLLGDINHIVQELMNRGQDPRIVFQSILLTGEYLRDTRGHGFYADVQQIPLEKDLLLVCIQPPCGGNVFLLETPNESVMVDTGYGIYSHDIARVIRTLRPGAMERLSRVVITHADADHCGAGGHYAVPALMHTGTRDIIRVSNRAYGSRSQSSILEEVYTSLINLFSQFCPPRDVALLLPPGESRRGRFSILATFDVGNHPVEVLEGMGGHLHGQIYLYSRDIGVFFSADTLINFDHLTPERARYNTLAVNLVTSVNVDSERAKEERKAILEIVRETSGQFYGQREKCLVCGGHGPVSILEGRSLLPFGKVVHIPPVGGGCPR